MEDIKDKKTPNGMGLAKKGRKHLLTEKRQEGTGRPTKEAQEKYIQDNPFNMLDFALATSIALLVAEMKDKTNPKSMQVDIAKHITKTFPELYKAKAAAITAESSAKLTQSAADGTLNEDKLTLLYNFYEEKRQLSNKDAQKVARSLSERSKRASNKIEQQEERKHSSLNSVFGDEDETDE